MIVLFLSPGFPVEMPFFVHGLARVGARVVGLGDQPAGALPPLARRALSGYVQVPTLWDDDVVFGAVREQLGRTAIEQVFCLWEPAMTLAARLRQRLGLAGMTEEQTLLFRDKERMKRALEGAGLRVPRHARAEEEPERRAAAERIGFPLVVKPIDGAGSKDTHVAHDAEQFEQVLEATRHVEVVSVEEYVEGEEYTFDTITVGGEILYYNVSWYRPKPLIARTVESLSPQTICLKQTRTPQLAPGRRLGRDVIEALGFETGFTHMEWFLTPEGEAVFGEIAARPPGARSVDIMNVAEEIDLFTGWAEAVCHGRFSQPAIRRFNAAVVFKRARGEGTIRRIEGLSSLLARYGDAIVEVDLLPIGARRRDWKQTLLSDGQVILRHVDLARLIDIADAVGTELTLIAEP